MRINGIGGTSSLHARDLGSEARVVRTFILAGSPLMRERLRDLCALSDVIEIVGEHADLNGAFHGLEASRPDLLLLAVEAEGAGALRKLPALHDSCGPLVVVVSSNEGHASVAFDVGAVDYLPWPLNDARFDEAIARVQTRLALLSNRELCEEIMRVVRDGVAAALGRAETRAPRRLVVERDKQHYFINQGDIESVAVDGNHLQVRAGKEQFRTRSSLREAESVLDPAIFMRVRRSVIVNTLKILKAERWFHGEYALTLESGQRVVSGREYRRRLLTYLKNHGVNQSGM